MCRWGLLVAFRGNFSDSRCVSVASCVRVLVASRLQFSVTTVVYQVRPTLLEWRWSQWKLITWYVVRKGKISLSIMDSSSVSTNLLLTIWNDGKWYIKCNEIREILGGNVMQNHDAGSEACLNRQILNNSIKRKTTEELRERPRKFIHGELQTQDLDTLT